MIPTSTYKSNSAPLQATPQANAFKKQRPQQFAPLFRSAESANTSMGPWKTLKTLAAHFTKPGNLELLKAYSVKYGGDVVVPALFSIPVVGWLMGAIALPFTWWTDKKGDKMVQAASKHHSNADNPFAEITNFHSTWSKGMDKPNVTHTLADHYDNFIKKLFPKKEDAQDPNIRKLRKTLKIGKKRRTSSKMFERLNRAVNAKKSMEKSWLYFPFKLFSWTHDHIKWVPRPLKRILLLPKFAFFGLFYMLKKAPK